MKDNERRSYPRVKPIEKATARVARREARLRDISLAGLGVELDSGFRVRSTVEVVLPAAGGSLHLVARVVRCSVYAVPDRNGRGGGLAYVAGLEFTDLGKSERTQLERFIVGVSMGSVSAFADSDTVGGAPELN